MILQIGDTYIRLGLILDIFSFIINSIGLMFIFKKCGQQTWKAFIPAYRDYAEAQCGDREMEGRIAFLTQSCTYIMYIMLIFIEGTWWMIISIAQLLVYLAGFIYLIRIRIGIIENFDRTKKWIIVFGLLPFVGRLIFGLNSKFKPGRTLADIDADDRIFFDRPVSILDSGLTVNLEDRSTTGIRHTTLLRDIHLNIKPGSMVLLLGGSGAGKTTLINAINGYEPANAEIMLDGRNVYKEYNELKYEIGYVPQLDLMRGSDTVLRTLDDAAALRLPQNFTAAERRARVNEVMKIFGLLPVQLRLVDKLSGGQRKRLSIAMEFLSNPSVFILDEPDSGLDGVMAREMMRQLRGIADQGKIVIVITHTPDRVIDLFDSVIVLAKDDHRVGRLTFYGSIDEAKTFFERDSMELIVKAVNRTEEGGDGLADELISKFMEVSHGRTE